MATKKCIDISYWQGDISVSNFKKIRKICDAVILRSSYTSTGSKFKMDKDSKFPGNIKRASEAGLMCGAYHFSQARTVAEAEKEANYICEVLKPYKKLINFYVAFDCEFNDRFTSKYGKNATAMANAFCKIIEKNGYFPVVYANYQMLTKYMTTKPKYPIWVAQYPKTYKEGDKSSYKGKHVMWQYTSSYKFSGISGRFDMSCLYSIPEKPESKPESVPEKKAYTGTYPDLVKHSKSKIAVTADDLSYALKTSKSTYTFPNGKPKENFKKAINKVYPKRKSWSKQCQAGASCDVGAGTIIRYSGVDPKFPRGLSEQIPWLKKNWKLIGNNASDIARGRVGVYSGNGGHIWIGLGDGIIAEANHTAKYFEHKVKKEIHKGNHKYFAIFEPKNASSIELGDKGTQVEFLQKYLNWYGANCGKPDGIAGEKTKGAIKKFQYEQGLTADGVFGSKSLNKAKAVKK